VRQQTNTKITKAVKAWNDAPMHVKAMAGGFAVPLVDALTAINEELAQIHLKIGKDDHGDRA